MSLPALIAELVESLEAARIPYMLTGSLAAAAHGAGRATMDIDLVIDPSEGSLGAFLKDVKATGRYASEEAARDALRNHSMFNVIDTGSGWKIDLIVLKDRDFSRTEFERRIEMPLGATTVSIATIEDLVIAKLEWAKLGGSVRQLDDVRELMRMSGDTLDRGYIERWVGALGIGVQWKAVQG